MDCLIKLAELMYSGQSIDSAVESVTWSEKFQQYSDFIETKRTEEISEGRFQELLRQIRLRKKAVALYKNYDEISNVIESIKDGSFDSLDDLLEDYEVTVKTLYSNIMEANRAITVEASASLDLVADEYDHVLNMILRKYQHENTTPTGFSHFDNHIMYGGFEPSRLYIFGGGSGSGKSTMLNNTIIESAQSEKLIRTAEPGKIKHVYVYVTLENTIEEALMRTYQPLYSRTIKDVLNDITSGVDIKERVMSHLALSSSTIVMKYFPAMSISVVDLMGVLDEVTDQYSDAKIAGLYVDYLDLLKTDTVYDLYRLQLGHITVALKSLAVQYNIPVITASQLGRDVYKVTKSSDLGVEMMSESIKKVEHADFVALLAKDPDMECVVHGRVGKNRSGKSNISLSFSVDWSRYKFTSVSTVSNKNKQDKTSSCDRSFNNWYGLDDALM
jgi:replicative DNA helicase